MSWDDNKNCHKRWFKCECLVCGNTWVTYKDNIIVGGGCPSCYKTGKITDHKSFVEKMAIIHPDIEIVGEYTNYHGKIRLRCKKDGYEWSAEPAKLFRTGKDGATGCPLCGGHLRLTHDEFCNRAWKNNPDIRFENTYKSVKTKIKCVCNKCGHKWEPGAFSLLYGPAYCPNCQANRSKGEMVIYNYLVDRGIKFEEQKKFEDCKDKFCLPFDFYLPDKRICIEYDGSQHFALTPHFSKDRTPEEQLKYYQFHDEIKNNYCINNSIKLVRINYSQVNYILEILDKEIA